MTRSTLLALALLTASQTAQARDERLTSRLYVAEEVVRIEGRMGVQAAVSFGEDEHIENVAVGDSAAWQITPNKRANLLFVKPLEAKARTNMTVVTDRHTYFFDLVAGTGSRPIYGLRFTYPEVAKPAETKPAQAALTNDEQGAIGAGAAPRPVDPTQLNFAWAVRGKPALAPARIFDDGTATFLAWAAGTPIPAILIRSEKGEEGPVNFAVRDDVIVVDGVPRLILLRSGKDSATLENQAPPRKPPEGAALAAAAEPSKEP